MTLRIDHKKWILYRHTSSFELLCLTARFLKSHSKTSITKDDKAKLNSYLKDLGLYNERNPDLPLDAINHKINQLSYYMFGYQDKTKGVNRFMFSPLGNLLLKHIEDKNKVAKIFLTMLWSLQFPHPHSGTDKVFNLYPFRLIFKLLLDRRLNFQLYAYEVSFLVVFIRKSTESIYEELISEIIRLRELSDSNISDMFQADKHAYVNSAYEWDYYVSSLFQSSGVLNKTNGVVICSLKHGNTETYRKITRNTVKINSNVKDLAQSLLEIYSFTDTPKQLNDRERLKIDVIKEIYSFYPSVLLESIGEVEEYGKLLELPKLIDEYSNNPENETAYLFEEVLIKGFNVFYNIEAKGIGGAGHTDIECLYRTKKKKFAVESKSTANKLLGINTGRLREHRDKIGGDYTIVITPRYVPAAKRDISGTPNVIILANTFAEFLYNCIENDIREVDYQDFDNIITNNLGKDISMNISNLTLEKFASIK